MGVAMSGWLDGKRARIEGDCPSLDAALERAGATLVADGEIDIWIHVAHAPVVKPAHDMTHAEWRQSLDAGLDQRFLGAKAFAAQCRAANRGGAVLFIGAPEQAFGADHAAAVGALGNLTKTLSVEWARDGIRFNSILTHDRGEAFGNLAAYLVSDYAAYVTGAVMGVGLND